MGVIGPNSYLPGKKIALVEPAECEHCQKPATCSIVGETDSFGSETSEYCDECAQKVLDALNSVTVSGRCDICGKDRKLRSRRDPQEGRCGPVYEVCGECSIKFDDWLNE